MFEADVIVLVAPQHEAHPLISEAEGLAFILRRIGAGEQVGGHFDLREEVALNVREGHGCVFDVQFVAQHVNAGRDIDCQRAGVARTCSFS